MMSPRGQRLWERTPAWVVVLSMVLLVVQVATAVSLALADGPEAPRPPRAEPPAALTVVVTGDRRTADVTFHPPSGGQQKVEDAALPLRRTFPADSGRWLVVSVQNRWKNGHGRVTCTVLAGDRVLAQKTSEAGLHEIATCGPVETDDPPLRGATVPAQGDGLLPGETRLTGTVPLKRYPGAGSPVVRRVEDGDPRLSYVELGGDWGPSRAVDPQLSGYTRKQSFDTEPQWEALIASGLVGGDLAARATGRSRLRDLAGGVLDKHQARSFNATGRGRDVASQPVRVGARRGWITAREIRFSAPDVRARLDLAAVVVVDTGRPRPSYVLINIPDTHRRLWPDVPRLLRSVRVG